MRELKEKRYLGTNALGNHNFMQMQYASYLVTDLDPIKVACLKWKCNDIKVFNKAKYFYATFYCCFLLVSAPATITLHTHKNAANKFSNMFSLPFGVASLFKQNARRQFSILML